MSDRIYEWVSWCVTEYVNSFHSIRKLRRYYKIGRRKVVESVFPLSKFEER
jgi:hypothetical protein